MRCLFIIFTMQKGNIGVTTENIFPVIKKFLYSDHEIFLREMVSNAVDATQKLKTLQQQGEFKGELGDLTVRVSVDADKVQVEHTLERDSISWPVIFDKQLFDSPVLQQLGLSDVPDNIVYHHRQVVASSLSTPLLVEKLDELLK